MKQPFVFAKLSVENEACPGDDRTELRPLSNRAPLQTDTSGLPRMVLLGISQIPRLTVKLIKVAVMHWPF